MTKLYYIVQGEMLTGGVIEAQVIAALRASCRIDGHPKTELIFLEPARVAFCKEARSTLKHYRRMWPGGKMTVVPYVSRFGDSSPANFLSLYLMRERRSADNIVFHCRGPAAAATAHAVRRTLGKGHVIFDVRGPYADETIHRLGFPWPTALSFEAERSYELCAQLEKRAASLADHVFTVSAGLKRYAIEELGASEERVLVVPSCVENCTFSEEARHKAREEWGVNDTSPVFLYAGRLGRERLPAHMFRVFGSLLRIRPDAKFVLMSYLNQLSDIESLMIQAGVPASSVLIARYPRDEALWRMCGADVGLLFCESARRYKDWFPIKFPEYLSAGLSMIVNSFVGNLPGLVRSRELGWIIDSDIEEGALRETAQRIATDLEEQQDVRRQRSLGACSELFLWRNHMSAIHSAYGLK